MISEFELIDLFNHIGSKYNKQNGIVVPPGDDCAVIDLPLPLVTSIDSSISDIHFPANASAKDIGYRSVAVALSPLSKIMERLAILEEEKNAADQRLEEEFRLRGELEEKFYRQKREILEEAAAEIQADA